MRHKERMMVVLILGSFDVINQWRGKDVMRSKQVMKIVEDDSNTCAQILLIDLLSSGLNLRVMY